MQGITGLKKRAALFLPGNPLKRKLKMQSVKPLKWGPWPCHVDGQIKLCRDTSKTTKLTDINYHKPSKHRLKTLPNKTNTTQPFNVINTSPAARPLDVRITELCLLRCRQEGALLIPWVPHFVTISWRYVI